MSSTALEATIARADLVPAPRFLTTPSGKLNWRAALDYGRWQRTAVRRELGRSATAAEVLKGASFGLRRRFNEETEARRANPYSGAADAVDSALYALDLTIGTMDRQHMVLAYHDGRACIVRNGRDYFAGSTLSTAVNLGCEDMGYVLSRPEQSVLTYAVKLPTEELASHVGLNDAGRAFLSRARDAKARGLFARAA